MPGIRVKGGGSHVHDAVRCAKIFANSGDVLALLWAVPGKSAFDSKRQEIRVDVRCLARGGFRVSGSERERHPLPVNLQPHGVMRRHFTARIDWPEDPR